MAADIELANTHLVLGTNRRPISPVLSPGCSEMNSSRRRNEPLLFRVSHRRSLRGSSGLLHQIAPPPQGLHTQQGLGRNGIASLDLNQVHDHGNLNG